ncbi:MAG TPA: hypothetical protein VG826_19115 [Pirellulales bacterium]|nr:hypothetical protein [Pirellulales bacterium]
MPDSPKETEAEMINEARQARYCVVHRAERIHASRSPTRLTEVIFVPS